MNEDPRRAPHVPAEPRPGPPPGQGSIMLLGVTIGVLLMAIQLWLLTLAFDLYLSGERTDTLVIAAVSGAIFLGGLLMLRLRYRPPRRPRQW